jgi:two-component system, OmpR family, response regulator
MPKILVVEDDKLLGPTIQDWLKDNNHTVELVADGREGLDRLKFYEYDLIILDWQLPAVSGLEICKHYRESGGKTPILFLTGMTEIHDKEAGLDTGADDYLTKPFEMRELSARLRALLRRAPLCGGNILEAGDLVLDTAACKLTKCGVEIELFPKEITLLEFFMRHPGQVFNADALLNKVWSSESDVSPDSIRSHIARLRSKIDGNDKPSMLRTVRGLGYKFEAP